MKKYNPTYIFLSCLLLAGSAKLAAQSKDQDKRLVQVSGLVTMNNGNTPIPFATVHIRNTFRGTVASVEGFYSLVAAEKDTIEYIALGFKRYRFIVPENAPDQKVTHNQVMVQDTFTYDETVIYPYPSKENFKTAFLNLKLDDNLYDIAKKNLDQQKLAELYETLARDGQEQQLYTLQQIALSSYYAGGQTNYARFGNTPIPLSLLSPFSWAQFIKSIKDGKYKNQKKDE